MTWTGGGACGATYPPITQDEPLPLVPWIGNPDSETLNPNKPWPCESGTYRYTRLGYPLEAWDDIASQHPCIVVLRVQPSFLPSFLPSFPCLVKWLLFLTIKSLEWIWYLLIEINHFVSLYQYIIVECFIERMCQGWWHPYKVLYKKKKSDIKDKVSETSRPGKCFRYFIIALFSLFGSIWKHLEAHWFRCFALFWHRWASKFFHILPKQRKQFPGLNHFVILGISTFQLHQVWARPPYLESSVTPTFTWFFRVQRFWVQGSRFRVQGSGFRVQGSGFRVQGLGFIIYNLEFRV